MSSPEYVSVNFRPLLGANEFGAERGHYCVIPAINWEISYGGLCPNNFPLMNIYKKLRMRTYSYPDTIESKHRS